MIGTLNHAIEVEDVWMASIRFANGAMASVTNQRQLAAEESYMRFDFQKATVELNHLYSYANTNWRYSPQKDALTAEALAQLQAMPTDVASTLCRPANGCAGQHRRATNVPGLGPGVAAPLKFLASLYKSAMKASPWCAARSPPLIHFTIA